MSRKKVTYRKKSTKRYVGKRRRHIASGDPRGFPGFPNNKIVKMRYVDGVYMNPTAGTPQTFFFSANSIFDPNRTGTGHQPIGRDQWFNFYNHYCVVGSKITVNFTYGGATTQSCPAICAVYLTDDITLTATSPDMLIEQGKSRWKYLPVAANSFATKTVYNTYSPKKFFNIKDIKDNVTRLGALQTVSPSEEAFFCLYIGQIDTSLDCPNVMATVTIEYSVMFSEPKELAQS